MVQNIIDSILLELRSEKNWLPPGHTWEELQKYNKINNFYAFYCPCMVAVVLVLIRYLTEM
jgi:hypothetical protein